MCPTGMQPCFAVAYDAGNYLFFGSSVEKDSRGASALERVEGTNLSQHPVGMVVPSEEQGVEGTW